MLAVQMKFQPLAELTWLGGNGIVIIYLLSSCTRTVQHSHGDAPKGIIETIFFLIIH